MGRERPPHLLLLPQVREAALQKVDLRSLSRTPRVHGALQGSELALESLRLGCDCVQLLLQLCGKGRGEKLSPGAAELRSFTVRPVLQPEPGSLQVTHPAGRGNGRPESDHPDWPLPQRERAVLPAPELGCHWAPSLLTEGLRGRSSPGANEIPSQEWNGLAFVRPTPCLQLSEVESEAHALLEAAPHCQASNSLPRSFSIVFSISWSSALAASSRLWLRVCTTAFTLCQGETSLCSSPGTRKVPRHLLPRAVACVSSTVEPGAAAAAGSGTRAAPGSAVVLPELAAATGTTEGWGWAVTGAPPSLGTQLGCSRL